MKTMEGKEFENILAKSLAPNMIRSHLLQNETMHDVIFLLGNNEEPLKAHKLFLMTASPIFHKIFSQNTESPLTIKLPQVPKSVMLEICRFAYTESVNLSLKNMLDIFNVASKFEMRFLIEKVLDYVEKQISENSVVGILEANQKQHRHWQVNKKCFDFIQKNHEKCLKNKSWLKLTPDLMRLVLSNCKIPSAPMKESLTAWSKSLGDSFDELDEMMAMITIENDDSDAESVVSHASSKVGQTKRKRRDRSRNKPATNKAFNTHCLMNIMGVVTVTNYQQATLELTVLADRIVLEQFEFLDVFLQTFYLNIFVIEPARKIQIYKENCKEKERSKFFKLKGRCELRRGQRFEIVIDFHYMAMRPMMFNCFDSPPTNNDLKVIVNLNKMFGHSLNGQIIRNVYYSK